MEQVSRLKDYWEREYERTDTPFDIEAPDEWVAGLQKEGRIHGNVLDAGCGPGRTSLYLADQGFNVLGIDISHNAIERAKQKAAERRSSARFLQADVCELPGCDNSFDTVIDIGCLHSLFDENARRKYAAMLHRVCRDGAAVYVRAISDTNRKRANYPAGRGLPALSAEQIRDAFAEGWIVDDLIEKEIDLLTDNGEIKKAHCRFAHIRRV